MKRILIFRLSSLGDVILATAALGGPNAHVEWVVAQEYVELLRGHPNLQKVHGFNRKEGLLSWFRFCRALRSGGYDEVWDLHDSLRTRLVRWFVPRLARRWRVLRKPRLRRIGFFICKEAWPQSLRPQRIVHALTEFSGVSASPSLPHFLNRDVKVSQGRVGVMPSSRWPGKEISCERWVQILTQKGAREVVVFGLPSDPKSTELLNALKRQKDRVVVSALGLKSWTELAALVQGLERMFAVDTGLAHFAEALGVPVHMVFGPTHPDLGFGPWRAESSVEMTPLWCRPCSKDGRRCLRLSRRYACLSGESP